METQIRNVVPGKSWCGFWSTEDMIKMLISEEDPNPIESLNCHSVATGGNLSIELETSYREDMAHDVLVINTCDGISYTYRKKKAKNVTVDISHPPEMRKEGIQINQSVDIQALEGFISELKESTLKDIQESCTQDDPKDKDYESDSSQEVVSPPQKKRDVVGLKNSNSKPKITPKRKAPDKKKNSPNSCTGNSALISNPPLIANSPDSNRLSLSRQLKNVERDSMLGLPLERKARSARFSLDNIMNK